MLGGGGGVVKSRIIFALCTSVDIFGRRGCEGVQYGTIFKYEHVWKRPKMVPYFTSTPYPQPSPPTPLYTARVTCQVSARKFYIPVQPCASQI